MRFNPKLTPFALSLSKGALSASPRRRTSRVSATAPEMAPAPAAAPVLEPAPAAEPAAASDAAAEPAPPVTCARGA